MSNNSTRRSSSVAPTALLSLTLAGACFSVGGITWADEIAANDARPDQPGYSQASDDEPIPYRDSRTRYRRLSLGGYGEMHVNIDEDLDNDLFDLHRQVLFLGYEFTDWIVFSSELEIEHAFVSKDSGGELGFEQAYVEFVLCDPMHVRAGRVLVPVGIINSKHEPPTFNGVERPSFAKFIIPSTWSADGVGVLGWLRPGLKYQAYVVTGLDGSQFSAKNGIRSGRIKERPSVNELAFTGRLDVFPFALHSAPRDQTLRMGVSTRGAGQRSAALGISRRSVS